MGYFYEITNHEYSLMCCSRFMQFDSFLLSSCCHH